MSRKADHSDLTDKEWEIIKPLIPPPKLRGHPRTVDMRSCSQCHFLSAQNWLLMGNASAWVPALLNGLLLLSTLAAYEDFGSRWTKLYANKYGWSFGISPQATAAIVDSQSVKTTEKKEPVRWAAMPPWSNWRGKYTASTAVRRVKGRKRHVVVDTQGLLMSVVGNRCQCFRTIGDNNSIIRRVLWCQRNRVNLGRFWIQWRKFCTLLWW